MDKWLKSGSSGIKKSHDKLGEEENLNIDSHIEVEEQETEPKKPKLGKRNINKFCPNWLENPEFMGWLRKSKSTDPKTGSDLAKCIVCMTTITAHKRVLSKHSQSERHKYHLKQVSNTPTIESMSRNAEIDMQVRRAELKLCSLLATNILPFSLMDTLSPLMENIFTDSTIAKQIAVRRTKATKLVKNVLGPSFENNLTGILRTKYFSLIMDETTDRSTIKQCAYTVIYCDDRHKVITKFFDMVEMESGTAKDLLDNLKNILINKEIPLQNLVGFSADTTNVMFGEKQSVVSLLKNELPHIVCIKCSCHMTHLATSKACLKLPRSVEDLLRNVGSHFSRSYSRIAKFKEFQIFFQTDIHKILSPSHTRWLSLKACVDRVLEQYIPLKEYFRETVFSDPSKTTEEMLVTFDNGFTHTYLEFMAYVLGLMTDFNILFQSETPLLHRLKPECEKLLKTICSNFIDIEHLRNMDIFNINHKNSAIYTDLDKVYVGISAHESITTIKMSPNLNRYELEIFYKSCQNFYIELCLSGQIKWQGDVPVEDGDEVGKRQKLLKVTNYSKTKCSLQQILFSKVYFENRMSIQNLNTFDPFADASKGADDDVQDGLVHIRIQQRNGRKTLTTVQGLSSEYDLKKIVRACKKEFACNGTVIEHPEYGEVLQLQGDQRENICQCTVSNAPRSMCPVEVASN
ncbi:hypothetical protein JTB14_005530 [Gonioctena quinquepunctata]|nr:hypothetical protein JTB14_005530 [Gonioctena quinquepunctata]